ncbi:hypothetical protein QZH41_015935 [Actinostola sp. cb2023]|nr:hypothetical protein QZH41_015935 [Actinostola sp. cb2023]
MKSAFSLGFLAVVFAVSTAQVEELNDANFREKVTSTPFVLIDFYNPKCPYCQVLDPIYSEAETKLKDSQSTVLVAKIDCTSDATKIACTKIRYVPWIVMFHNGKQIKEYGERSRDVATIIDFVTNATKDQSNQQKDLSFPKVQPQNTCDQGLKQAMAAVVQTPSIAGLPAVADLTDATFNNFMKSSPYVIVDYYTPWCTDCKHLKPMYDEAAAHLAKTSPSIKFATVDCNQGNTATFLTCAASKLKFYPWVVLYHDGKPISYYNSENVPNTDAIYNFINKDTNVLGGVMELDDSNFLSTIATLPFAVVNFYAPWCFYCKKMAPIYDEVAKQEQTAHPNVRLVKVDCSATNAKTKTTCSSNDIAFLPTLKIFENGRFVKEYEGDKTKKDGLSGFINDAVNEQQQSIRRTMESKKNDKDKEGSSDDNPDKKDNTTIKKKKKKTSDDKKSKTGDKKVTKNKDKSINAKAARILKNVFKQFRKKSHSKKSSKHNDDDDDDDEESNSSNSNPWKQVAKDIHHIAHDIHKMTKEFHKSMRRQPAVDRLVKAFHKLVKTKDEDEDDF